MLPPPHTSNEVRKMSKERLMRLISEHDFFIADPRMHIEVVLQAVSNNRYPG